MSTHQVHPATPSSGNPRLEELTRLTRHARVSNTIALGVLWAIAAIVIALFVFIIIDLLVQGASTLFNLDFYGTGPTGIAFELFNTFYVLILTEIFLFPIALAAAIYLVEYARQGPLVTIIHFAAETLAGVPSIVLGLFGFLAFAVYAHLGTSRLAGA